MNVLIEERYGVVAHPRRVAHVCARRAHDVDPSRGPRWAAGAGSPGPLPGPARVPPVRRRRRERCPLALARSTTRRGGGTHKPRMRRRRRAPARIRSATLALSCSVRSWASVPRAAAQRPTNAGSRATRCAHASAKVAGSSGPAEVCALQHQGGHPRSSRLNCPDNLAASRGGTTEAPGERVQVPQGPPGPRCKSAGGAGGCGR